MPLPSGHRLGAYEIVGPLGAGGMGEVYRARDTRLQRDVAVKVLTSTLAGDPHAIARFEREAQSVAQLSHPNILAIHDVGTDAGTAYAVTELLEGQTLRDRLASGPLTPRKAIEYALHIARGLAAAHDKGIVHRDLKPENVFITRDDRVKILDFGLAKPAELPAAGATMTAHVATAAGTVLGTFGYMAPEQVRAQTIDHRADIFAFGALLYEMLSGRRAFAGDTPADTISAILQSEPSDMTLAADGMAPSLDRIVRRALDKRPELRFQSAHDLAFALETVVSAAPSGARTAVAGREPGRAESRRIAQVLRAIPWLVALAAIGAAAWSASRSRAVSTSAPTTRLEMSLPAGVELHVFGGSMALSRDGRAVAFIGVDGGKRQAYLRWFDQSEARPVKGTETAFRLFFSPDGQRLGAVVTDGTFRLITLSSGLVTPIAEQTDFFGATWTTNDEIVFTRDGGLWRMAASGGVATKIADAGPDSQFVFPSALPDPRTVIASVVTAGRTDIVVVTLATGERRTLVPDGEYPLYTDSGHLLFLRGGMLMAARFDLGTQTLTGPQVPVQDGLPSAARAAVYGVSSTGTLMYVQADALQSHLVWVSREGVERTLTKTSRRYGNPRVSPDGRQVLMQTASGDFWIHDVERDTLSRLVPPVASVGFPLWSPDGRDVLFKSATGVHRLRLSDGGHSHLDGSVPTDYPSGISPDGRHLAVARLTGGTSSDIYIHSLSGTNQARAWLSTPTYDGGATWSPDGRWMVYQSMESGQPEVYLQPFPGPGVRRQVSIDGGGHPLWSRDGRELFYRHNSRVYVVKVDRRGDDIALSQPRLLFDRLYGFGQGISIPNYDVSADGREFVFVKDSGATHLNVVLNWFTELHAKTK